MNGRRRWSGLNVAPRVRSGFFVRARTRTIPLGRIDAGHRASNSKPRTSSSPLFFLGLWRLLRSFLSLSFPSGVPMTENATAELAANSLLSFRGCNVAVQTRCFVVVVIVFSSSMAQRQRAADASTIFLITRNAATGVDPNR